MPTGRHEVPQGPQEATGKARNGTGGHGTPRRPWEGGHEGHRTPREGHGRRRGGTREPGRLREAWEPTRGAGEAMGGPG